jgi:hypothetical protein
VNAYEQCANELAMVRKSLGLPPADPASLRLLGLAAAIKSEGMHISATREGLVILHGRGHAEAVFLSGQARRFLSAHIDCFNF